MTFLELQTEVQTLVIDTPTAIVTLVPRFVNRAVKKLQKKHNFKIMEAELVMTTSTLVRTLDNVPSDWKEPRGDPYHVRDLGGYGPMKYASQKSQAIARYGNNPDYDFGEPRLLVEDNDTLKFTVFPYPDGLSDYVDGEYRITAPYWKFLPTLTTSGETNWFTINADEYIIYRATAYAFYANEDEDRGDHWLKLAAGEYHDVILADKERRLGETETLAVHQGALPPHTQE